MTQLGFDLTEVVQKQMKDINNLKAELEKKQRIIDLKSLERYVFTGVTVQNMAKEMQSKATRLYIALMFLTEIQDSINATDMSEEDKMTYLFIMYNKINLFFPELKKVESAKKRKIIEIVNSALHEIVAEANVIVDEIDRHEIPTEKSTMAANKIKFEAEKISKIGIGEVEI